MPEVIFNGPDGRLEGRYHHSRVENAPIALILHPHPQQGGTMNNRVDAGLTIGEKTKACTRNITKLQVVNIKATSRGSMRRT